MPARGLGSAIGIMISDIVGAASAANESRTYSRLKPLPRCCYFSIAGMAAPTYCGVACRKVA